MIDDSADTPETEDGPAETGAEAPEDVQFRIVTGHAPSIQCDYILGTAQVAGSVRIMVGEFVLNDAPNATRPAVRPTANIVVQKAYIHALVRSLSSLVETDEDGDA